jgi:hypothetical protein
VSSTSFREGGQLQGDLQPGRRSLRSLAQGYNRQPSQGRKPLRFANAPYNRDFLLSSCLSQSSFGENVADRSLIADHFEESRLQERLLPAEDQLAHIRLYFGIREFMLSSTLLFQQLDNMIAIFGHNDARQRLSGLKALDGSSERRFGVEGIELLG